MTSSNGSACSEELSNQGYERLACTDLDPKGFFIRHPPAPHELNTFITPDSHVFQTIHMGGAVVDLNKYLIIIDGLVKYPLSITLAELKNLPSTAITAFHECYGSPIKPPTENVWRIGNVTWTGVPLKDLLTRAQPLPEAQYVWSEGLDFGEFAGVAADRYQKDLPLEKATSPEVILAYEINGQPLTRNRGGPVRLIVPGWFGTNMTKWLCRISLQDHRAPGPFTATFYNEVNPNDPAGGMRPVWQVEPNSMIASPAAGSRICASSAGIEVVGWAWSDDGVSGVEIGVDDDNKRWISADVEPRCQYSWQSFRMRVQLEPGKHRLRSRARCESGLQQPLSGRRNHVHTVEFDVLAIQ